jgi:hypothetical protein
MRAATLLLTAILFGCGPGVQDAGAREDVDAGVAPENALPADAIDYCYALEDRVCAGGDCDDEPSCVAARVLLQYDPGACEAAFTDEARWPRCEPSPCERLVERVCGGEGAGAPCADEAGCGPAVELLERARGDDADERASALSSCSAALEDDVVFAACVPS